MDLPSSPRLFLHPRYRTERPLDSTLLKADPAADRFVSEKYADEISKLLVSWSDSILQLPQSISALEKTLAPGFKATSPKPSSSRTIRSNLGLEVRASQFSNDSLTREKFLRDWQAAFSSLSKVNVAEFQITAIDIPSAPNASPSPISIETTIRYEILGNRPALVVAAKDEFRFDLSLLLQPGVGVGLRQIIIPVVVHDFQQCFVCTVDVLELDIQHGVDPALAREQTEAVLPTIAGEQRALGWRSLTVEIPFARPPRGDAVFELRRRA